MKDLTTWRDSVTGVILAGGEARRMGGNDKGLIQVAGRPMIEFILEAFRPQVTALLINANRNRERYEKYGFRVIADELEGFNGPLAGMASGMRNAETEYMATLPCDSPYVPDDLVARLYRSLVEVDADISVAHNGERLQPVYSLMKCSLLQSLLAYLNSGERKIDRWYARHRMTETDFSDVPETFINANTPEDIAEIEKTLNHA